MLVNTCRFMVVSWIALALPGLTQALPWVGRTAQIPESHLGVSAQRCGQAQLAKDVRFSSSAANSFQCMPLFPCFVLLRTAICFQWVTIFFYVWTYYKCLAASLFCSTNTAVSHWCAGQSVISRGWILVQFRYSTEKYGSLRSTVRSRIVTIVTGQKGQK